MKRTWNGRGEMNPNSKLNPQIVREIRDNRDGLSVKQLAAKYRVSVPCIVRVRGRKTWADVA